MRASLTAHVLAALIAVGTFAVVRTAVKNATPDNDTMGVTYCVNDEPIAFINLRVLGTIDEKSTIAHERKHVEQIMRFDNCILFEAWFLRHEIEAEAEAFCEDIKVETSPTFPERITRMKAINKYAEWLRTYKSPPITTQAAIQAIEKFC
jgi:hypothetical protein